MHRAEPDVFTAGLRASALCQIESPLSVVAAARQKREGPEGSHARVSVYTDEVLEGLVVGDGFDGSRCHEVGRELDSWWLGPVKHGVRAQSPAPLSLSPEQSRADAVDGRLEALQKENLHLRRLYAFAASPQQLPSPLSHACHPSPCGCPGLNWEENDSVWQASLARATAAASLPQALPN
jgi:hypothetical protein